MGYWIGKPYWNQGFGTEAALAILRYAFEQLGLNRVYAAHFRRNPASGRIMQKIGMTYEGRLRQHVKKWGDFEDMEYYGHPQERVPGRVGQRRRRCRYWHPLPSVSVPQSLS